MRDSRSASARVDVLELCLQPAIEICAVASFWLKRHDRRSDCSLTPEPGPTAPRSVPNDEDIISSTATRACGFRVTRNVPFLNRLNVEVGNEPFAWCIFFDARFLAFAR